MKKLLKKVTFVVISKNFFDLFVKSACIIVGLTLCSLGTSKALAQGERSDYVPFVEEGKAWYCVYGHNDGSMSPLKDPKGNDIDCIFTMLGDTLINDREYEKVYCLFEEYYGNKEQHYYCAVREEACQVFIVEEKTTDEKLIYDFSHPTELLTLTYDEIKYVRTRGERRYDFLPGQLEYGVCKLSGDEIEYSNGSSSWIDGVGASNYNPFAIEMPFLQDKPKLGKYITVVTCMRDDKCIYDLDWMAEPTEQYKEDVPFVEEGKAWYCVYGHNDGSMSPLKDPKGNDIDCIFTMRGDTLINDREYEKVYCLFEEYYGNKEQHYYCAVREEACQVFIVEEKTTDEKLIYDFSHPTELLTLTYDEIKYVRTRGVRRYDFLPGQLEYGVYKLLGDEIEYSNSSSTWIDGVGAFNYNPFAIEMPFLQDKPKLGKYITVVTCMRDDKCIYDLDWMAEPIDTDKKCATPTISYDKGKLVFSCETPGAECVYEISCSDNGSGRGGEVSLSQTYEIRVHATLDGYEDSDVATAIIGWCNGKPVMEGFSSVTLGDDEQRGDVNGDGIVDVADIATVISVIAAQKSE